MLLLLLLLLLTVTLCQNCELHFENVPRQMLLRSHREKVQDRIKKKTPERFFSFFLSKDMEIPSQIGFQVGLLREDRWPLLRRLFKCGESNSFSHFHSGLTAEHRSLAPPAVPTLALIGGPAGLRRPRSALMEPLGSPCRCDSSVVYHCSLSGKVLKLLMGEGGAPTALDLV